MTAQKRKLTPMGASWLRGIHVPEMKLPEPIITSVLYYERVPQANAVADLFEKHIWPLYRFGSRVHNGEFIPVVEGMNRAYHFQTIEVADEGDIDAYVQKVMCNPLDKAHPLWHITIINSRSGRSAMVVRIHHVISDGLGLLFAFLPIMEVQKGEVLDTIPLPSLLTGKKSTSKQPVQARVGFLARCFRLLLAMPGALIAALRGALTLLVVKPDAEIKINPPVKDRKPFLGFSGRHVFTRMPPIPMELIKTIRAKFGCSVNDVIMAGLAGAIRRYGSEDLSDALLQHATSKQLECKCTMLLGLPRPIDPKNPSVCLRNNILTPMCRLPIGEPSVAARLKRTVAICNDLKSGAYLSGIKMTTDFLTSVAPVKILQKAASEALSKITCNVTSMPFTTVPMKMWGSDLKEIQVAFVNNVPQIAFISYAGVVHWNIVADPQLIPDPAALGKHMLADLKELADSKEITSEGVSI
jgi:diacylglycerol O-acyltransferase / wax synthase